MDQARGGAEQASPEVFGRYVLRELLGRGAMGEVWRAYDRHNQREVALKRMNAAAADDPGFRERFLREARITASLVSPHAITLHDYGEIDGRLYLDMRLVEGSDLALALRQYPGGLGQHRAVTIVAQVADALDGAHANGLVHRDVKPSNIVLGSSRGEDFAYLVDFGIAKATDQTGLTGTGATIGTVAYMAPELFGEVDASARSDVYALGCVLFEALTGRRAVAGTGVAAVMHAHVAGPVPRTGRDDLAGFDPIIATALAKAPEDRYRSAGELARAATRAAGEALPAPPPARPAPPVLSAPTEVGPPARRPSRWASWRLRLGAGALAILVGIVVGAVARSTGTSPPPPPATVTASAPQRLFAGMSRPSGVAFSPDGRRAYVTDLDTNALTVLDSDTGTPVATLPVGAAPVRVTVAPDGRRAYVTNIGTDQAPGTTVSVVDTATNTVTATITVGFGPLGVVISPDGRRAYVTNFRTERTGTLSVIDTVSNAVIATVGAGPGANRPGLSPDGSRLYVPNSGAPDAVGATVTVVDTATYRTTTLAAGDLTPDAVLVSPDGRRVYVVCHGTTGPGSVQVLDTATNTITPLGPPLRGPLEAALSPDGRTLVIPEQGPDNAPGTTVALVDTATGAHRTVTVSGRPTGAGVTPDGRAAWVTTVAPGGLWRIPL